MKRTNGLATAAKARLECLRLEDRCTPADFTVNTGLDTSDANLNDGVAQDAMGRTSLRAVIEQSNQAPRTGDFATNKYTVEFNVVGGVITLTQANALPELKSNFSFLGSSGITLQRDANQAGQYRLLEIKAGTIAVFEAMTFTGGSTTDNGGAILNYGKASFDRCSFYDNSADGFGGAIYSGQTATSLGLSSSSLWLNTAGMSGGAVAALGQTCLLVLGTDIFSNTATGTIEEGVLIGGVGGGLYINTPTAEVDPEIDTLARVNSAIYGNTAAVSGGGIYVMDSNLTVNAGTIHGNTATNGYGGGIYVDAANKTVTLTGLRLTNNTAGGKGGGAYVRRGHLKLEYLTEFSGNSATGGIPGAGYKANAATLTITNPPAGAQSGEQDP